MGIQIPFDHIVKNGDSKCNRRNKILRSTRHYLNIQASITNIHIYGLHYARTATEMNGTQKIIFEYYFWST
jgi:hypothetical protein